MRMLFSAVLMLFAASSAQAETRETAVFAGGCFWCVESNFDEFDGVLETTSGFSGGHVPDVTYRQVVAGGTGHIEVVKIDYDAEVISYAEMLDIFLRSTDVVDGGGQFCDRGHSYKPAIFAQDDSQRAIAEDALAKLEASGILPEPLAVPILDAAPFYPAEEYHQGYHQKNPLRYRYYRFSCGRDARVKELWGDLAITH